MFKNVGFEIASLCVSPILNMVHDNSPVMQPGHAETLAFIETFVVFTVIRISDYMRIRLCFGRCRSLGLWRGTMFVVPLLGKMPWLSSPNKEGG